MTSYVSVVDAVRGMAEAVTSDAGMTASATILCASVVGLALARVARSSGTSSKTSGTIVSMVGWGGKTREVRGGGDEGKLRLTVFYGTQTVSYTHLTLPTTVIV